MKKFLIFLSIVSLFCSCNTNESEIEQTDILVLGDTIVVKEESAVKSMLKLYRINTEAFRQELSTAGIVRAIPNNYAEIAPPFAGRVLRSFVRLGQNVSQGSPIFEISSPDYFNAQKEYFDAKQAFYQAELNLKRQQDLLSNGVGVQRELEVAETEYKTGKTALENAAAALKIFNINPEKMVLGQPLVVTSPINGEVIDNKIVIGQYLKEDAEAIVVVAELSNVWIGGQVKEKDVHLIQKFDKVEISVPAFKGKIFKGEVYHVKELVDEDTRSVEVLVSAQNNNRIFKPGMYVTVKFIDKPENSILIPSKAVMQKAESQFVFVNVGKNKYQRRAIETQATIQDKVLVTSGLSADETIVSEGGIYLLEAK
ncbi:MAG: efflux RND transporter periplasmic adaptor subunit [Cytophagales bacterium]